MSREGPGDAAGSTGARAAVRALAARHEVDPELPAACEAEAAAWVADPGVDDPALEDLTHLAFATIDEPTSRDLDQAVFLEVVDGLPVVWYAIADASHYVRPGSALLEEAVARGATFYLPGLVAPMLPRALCEGQVSLNPGVPRRAVVLRMALDGGGRCVATDLSRARIVSRAKLSYAGVQAWVDGGALDAPGEVRESLAHLAATGELRLREAESRDVLLLRRHELVLDLGGCGMVFVAHGEARNDVERWNEQVSLLANVEAARLLGTPRRAGDAQPIYRTHEPPHRQALEEFAALLRDLADLHGLDPGRWTWDPGGAASLATFVRELPLADPRHGGLARAIQRQALRTGGRSGFGPTPGVHHGVGATAYTRFTAPMREVVGIMVHKELLEAVGATVPGDPEADAALRERVLAAARRARGIQRALDHGANRLVLDQLFRADLAAGAAPGRDATVMGFGRGKVHLQLGDPPIDVKVYAADLAATLGGPLRVEAGAPAVLDAAGAPVLRVGDPVRVAARGLDPDRDRWVLHVEAASR